MIERIPNLPQGILGLRAQGELTRADYEDVFLPLLEEARQKDLRLRVLAQFGPDFEGFSVGGAWEEARAALQHARRFERCAVVTDIEWIRRSAAGFGALSPEEITVFANSELERAVDWLLRDEPDPGLSIRMLDERRVLVVELERPLRSNDLAMLGRVVDGWIERHGALEGLVIRAASFPGWENLGAMIRHLRFVRQHHRDVQRVALVADGKLAQLLPKLTEHFVAARLEHFDFERLDEAIEWTATGTPYGATPEYVVPTPPDAVRRAEERMQRIEAARRDPLAVFGTPERLVEDAELTRAQKIEILRSWEQDAYRLAESEAEGMGGGERPMIDRIHQAMHELGHVAH